MLSQPYAQKSAESASSDGRNETEGERLDRKFEDLLQELRVTQTGAQLIAGILVTLPFQDIFGDLDRFQKGLYLVVLVAALLTTSAVMTPVAVHRRLTGKGHKQRVLKVADAALNVVMLTISVLLVGISILVFDLVVDRTTACVVGGALGVLLVGLLVVLPRRLDSFSQTSGR